MAFSFSKLPSTQARPSKPGSIRPQSSDETSLPESLAASDNLVDAIYRVVRRPGKDTGFVRMSTAEKSALAQLVTTINQRFGWKVTETELIRIAVCSLLAEHAQNADDSFLMRVIEALKG